MMYQTLEIDKAINPLQQHQKTPLFKINNDGCQLRCVNCEDSILIEGYNPDSFVGLSIRCSECMEITTTPHLEIGEILPRSLLVCKDPDGQGFKSTRLIPSGTAVTSHEQLAREQSLVHPRSPVPAFDMSNATMHFLDSEYDRVGGGSLHKQAKALHRHVAQKDWGNALRNYPYLWSCGRLRRMQRLQTSFRPLRDFADAAAITNLEVFHKFIRTWGHHPRLNALSNDFMTRAGFHHAMTVFACLREFYLRGIKVGIAPPVGNGSRTADLYIRQGVGQKYYLEIKVPLAFRYPECLSLNTATICDSAMKSLQDAKKQIGSSKPGILVLSINFVMPQNIDGIRSGLRQAIDRIGRDYLDVAGILLLHPRFETCYISSPTRVDFGHSCIFQSNPHFNGDNVFMPIFPFGF